jgi:3-hydroxyisobutyrate dehydrogenase-like beta-hydroxyacid dehydrogenase
MSTEVGVIGLGAMGTALAAAFLKKVYPTTIWNRTAAKAAPLIGNGAHLATSISAAYDSSDIIIFCVLNNSIVEDLLGQDAARLNGKIITNSTNGTLEEARHLSAFVQGHGAQYLHAALMAVPAQIGTDDGFIIYSGHERAYDSIRAHVSILGENKYIGSDPGSVSEIVMGHGGHNKSGLTFCI